MPDTIADDEEFVNQMSEAPEKAAMLDISYSMAPNTVMPINSLCRSLRALSSTLVSLEKNMVVPEPHGKIQYGIYGMSLEANADGSCRYDFKIGRIYEGAILKLVENEDAARKVKEDRETIRLPWMFIELKMPEESCSLGDCVNFRGYELQYLELHSDGSLHRKPDCKWPLMVIPFGLEAEIDWTGCHEAFMLAHTNTPMEVGYSTYYISAELAAANARVNDEIN